MWRDFLLASAHHVLLVGLVAMLASQAALLRTLPAPDAVRRLARLDAAYGITAMLLLVVGAMRVAYGIKGAAFYLHNPWFHAKVGLFVLAALLSIIPTVAFRRWLRDGAPDTDRRPDAASWSRARALVRTQLVLIVLIAIAAAGMARYGGL